MAELPIVLVAEDEMHIRELISAALLKEGRYDVHTAVDGEDAINRALQIRPAVAVLDLMMPKTHGLNVCRTIKEGPSTAHTGVIMLTAIGSRYSKNQAAEYGADAYLTKPFSPRELINTVDIVLRNRPERAAMGKAPKQPASIWEFQRGQQVVILAGPGEPEYSGVVKGRFLASRDSDKWGYVVALDTGVDVEVPWDSVRPANVMLDRAV